MHSTFSREEAAKLGSSRTRWRPIFKSTVPGQYRKERVEEVPRYNPKRLLLVKYMRKPRISILDRCLAMLDTWIADIAADMRLEEHYSQKLLIPSTGGGFFINEKFRVPPKGTATLGIV